MLMSPLASCCSDPFRRTQCCLHLLTCQYHHIYQSLDTVLRRQFLISQIKHSHQDAFEADDV